jgi:hypothetical protein
MNSHAFDAIARHLPLTTSRRGIARIGSSALAAAVLARIGLSPSGSLAAKSGRCKTPCGECQRCDPGKCRKKPNGQKRCKRGRCTPKPDFIACSFGFCFAGACTPT